MIQASSPRRGEDLSFRSPTNQPKVRDGHSGPIFVVEFQAQPSRLFPIDQRLLARPIFRLDVDASLRGPWCPRSLAGRPRYQTARRGVSWETTIHAQRKELLYHLDDTPSLEPKLQETRWLDMVWSKALAQAVNETGLVYPAGHGRDAPRADLGSLTAPFLFF